MSDYRDAFLLLSNANINKNNKHYEKALCEYLTIIKLASTKSARIFPLAEIAIHKFLAIRYEWENFPHKEESFNKLTEKFQEFNPLLPYNDVSLIETCIQFFEKTPKSES